MEQILSWLHMYLMRYSDIEMWFSTYWEQYGNIIGFIAGFIIIILVYLTCDHGVGKAKEMAKTLAVIALVNAFDGTYMILMELINSFCFHQKVSEYESMMSGAFNPLSIMMMVLVISAYYKKKPRQAFFFGASVFAVSMVMNSSLDRQLDISFYLMRVAVMPFLCIVCSKITYSFVAYMILSLYYMVTEMLQILLLSPGNGFTDDFVSNPLGVIASYKAEYMVIIFITIIFALFEIFVLSGKDEEMEEDNDIPNNDIHNNPENEEKERRKQERRYKIEQRLPICLFFLILIGSACALVYAINKIDERGYAVESSQFVEEEDSNEQGMADDEEEDNDDEAFHKFKDRGEHSIVAANVIASSYLVGSSGKAYGPEYTLDGSYETCWQDGQSGDGVGESLTYFLDNPRVISEIAIINGQIASEQGYYENSRLSDAEAFLYMDDQLVGTLDIHISDIWSTYGVCTRTACDLACNKIVIKVTKVYPGSMYQDLCITEVWFEESGSN